MSNPLQLSNRSLRASSRSSTASLAWSQARQALLRTQPEFTPPAKATSAFTLLCHAPVVSGQGMIDAMDGGIFLYLYPLPDPTAQLTSAARVMHGFPFDVVLRQPANRILVADFALTGVTERGGTVEANSTVRGYTDEALITAVSFALTTVSAPQPLVFGVDGILPNAVHQVVGVPPPNAERWISATLEAPAGCVLFVSTVTAHIA